MIFPVNESGIIWGLTLSSAELTGSLFLTFLLTVLFFVFLCMLFRLPLWASSLFVLPYVVVVASYTSEFLPLVGVVALYLGLVLADVFVIR